MSDREELVNLIRNEYDPMPDLGKGAYPAFESSWDDGAGRIADAIIADQMLAERRYADELAKSRAETSALRKALEEIKQATVDGRVCDDVAWFDSITTLHDFCEAALTPSSIAEKDEPAG